MAREVLVVIVFIIVQTIVQAFIKKPCNGATPVQVSEGVPMFCGRGPNRVDCPKWTYCDIDPADRFATCCHGDRECRNRKRGVPFINARCTERCTCDFIKRKRCSPLCPQVLIKCLPFYVPKFFKERIPGTKCFCNKPRCVPVKPRPCYGDKLPVNPRNGRPYNCFKSRCPRGTFCHSHPADQFSVCCRIRDRECRNRKPGVPFMNARCTERCTCDIRRRKRCSPLCPQVLIKCAPFYVPKFFKERIPGTKCFCNKPRCVPVTPRPCFGDKLLINPVDGRPYNCFRSRCPSGAFCHSHPADQFSVCCRKQSKPGRCPKNRIYALCKVTRPICISDHQCPGNKRCCPSLCSRRCLTPLRCGPLCEIYCKYGNVHVNGCPICKCKENPCKKVRCPPIRPRCIVKNRNQALCVRSVVTPRPCYGDKPLINPVNGKPYNCFINRCPRGAFCHSDPVDRFSVCCRRQSKPGRCPKPNILTICKLKLSRPACVSDHQCPGKKRCCPSGCSAKCVDPIPCSPFTCFIFCKYGKKVINGCPSCICRENPCKGIRCPLIRPRCIVKNNQPLCVRLVVVPIPKPGKCPPPPNILCVRAENKCFSDRNCPGRQKCCPGGCGTLCRNPVPAIKPGKCPRLRSRARCSNHGCRFDSDCNGRAKCCIVDRCGRHCVNPIPLIKPGKCPRLRSKVRCSRYRCRYDSDCKGRTKCCAVDKCGRHCVSPVPVTKPGKCPRLRSSVRCTRHRCRYDSDCKGRTKCCVIDRCGRQCVSPVVPIPKPGKCPPPPNILCVRAENKCFSDRNCPGNQKCCAGGCGTLCRYPVVPIPKPGKCPPPSNIVCVRAEIKCFSDRNCPGIQKCCAGGCGTLCRYPAFGKQRNSRGVEKSDGKDSVQNMDSNEAGLVRPGYCPDTSGIITTCQVTPLNCFSDSFCLPPLKCCPYGCGKRCLQPVPYKGK